MRITSGASGLDDLTIWRIKRFAEGMRDKEGMEELADPAIGPDVRYVLNTNNIELVKRYLRSPITIEEYRELRHKLLQLQLQKTTVHAVARTEEGSPVPLATIFNATPEMVLRQEEREAQRHKGKDTLIDLVA
ncbi:MAG: hypothetical protein N3B18_08185 [Desulfobacterota bacterium]|nr:hypothetical protein [Thermodesulfobacteriota bacterium]